MNILIVDDDMVSRTKMKTILQKLGTCTDVECPEQSVEIFEQALNQGRPFHVVTLDIRMPGMDGTQVLFKFREIEHSRGIYEHSRSKVFMVTSQSDKDSLITCLQAGCDGFIVKPFTPDILVEKLSAMGIPINFKASPETDAAPSKKVKPQRKDLIQEVTLALKGDQVSLPSLPDINTQMKEMVANQGGVFEITELLKKDMLIAGSLISLSNSPLFKGVEQSKTLDEAVNRLGIDQTFSHVEMMCQRALYSDVAGKYKDYVERLWTHAQSCAYASQCASDHLNLALSEDPFTLGLVHDIGRLILLQIISKLEAVGPTGEDVDQAVLFRTLDTYHGQFGAALLDKWGFSKTVQNVAKHHHNPASVKNPSNELILVSFANSLVHMLERNPGNWMSEPCLTFCVKALRLDFDAVEKLGKEITATLKEMVG
jgi:HD-like signal output (HDOD) protein/FixJ family two-component response regulator